MRLWLFLIFALTTHAGGAPFISEILINPPGNDEPNEYIELRGTPNSILPPGSYFVAVEGDAGGNPGTIQNVFDLSGRAFGGNGYLLLLEKSNTFVTVFGATVMANSGPSAGFGHDDSSSISHLGESGATDLENPSVTFFLLRSTVEPDTGDDIDSDNDGTPEGDLYSAWTILDSVGILDADGAGDIVYGAVNFRRNTAPGNGALASGTVVGVGFNPAYVARNGNSTGNAAADWVGGDDLVGVPPNYQLGENNDTLPSTFAGAPLTHMGGPNFGGAAQHGIIISEPAGNTTVLEGGAANSYTVSLNTPPAGAVTIQIEASAQVQISTDNGANYGALRTIVLSSTTPKTVHVRAPDDAIVDTSPHVRPITHAVTSSGDATRYPVGTVIPNVAVQITENDSVLLNEVKVNPPGDDQPHEFIEIRGTPSTHLTNVYVVALEGNNGADPGTATLVVDLSNRTLGNNGLLLIVGAGHNYRVPPSTPTLTESNLGLAGGALGNGSVTLLLLSSPSPIIAGEDLDQGDNGLLEKLPKGTTILDSVGWRDGGTNDVVYTLTVLSQVSGVPDAAARFPGNDTPNSADAWFNGDLSGFNGDSLIYDEGNVGPDFPFGTVLTPGMINNTAPVISPLAPLSGVIGDPTNPEVTFLVSDDETPPETITVIASSSDPAVIPDANLVVTSLGDGVHRLRLNPVGAGYSTITLTASDGTMFWQTTFPYAASATGGGNSRWHTGLSDASAAIPIDSDLTFVADDENQTIRIYSRHFSGPPINGFNFTPSLGLTDIENGFPREVDIEGATKVGNRIFWIGSHSHANISEVRTNRSRIFATDVSGAGAGSVLTYVGRYEHLKADLINWDNNNVHGRGARYFGFEESAAEGTDPKSVAGLNIEGLAMAPGSATTGYIAFRAPTASASNRFYALIVPVVNFSTLAIGNGPLGSAVFGPPIQLDLYGRAIRSIEGNNAGYLIVAGASSDLASPYPHDFKLYTWTGQPNDQPQQRAADLSAINPEAIVELPPGPWSANSEVQLLSDNGRTIYYNDDTIAKRLTVPNFKKFRSDVVKLGAVVKPAPIILSSVMTGGQVLITWRALTGSSYRLQYKTALADPAWTDLPGAIFASGPIASSIDLNPPATQRYYHVVVLP